MKRSTSIRTYAMISASILLATGIVGFAFRDQFDIPTYILLVDLVLGVWGMFSIFGRDRADQGRS